MKKTKSKLNLNELQSQFDELLMNFDEEDISSWKSNDMESQREKLFNGKTIEVYSNPISYLPISCSVDDMFYSLVAYPIKYDHAA